MEGVPHNQTVRVQSLDELRAGIEAVERRHITSGGGGGAGGASLCVVTGWGPPAPSLARGVLHEWFGPHVPRGQNWTAPLLIFAHLARQAMHEQNELGATACPTTTPTGGVVGKPCERGKAEPTAFRHPPRLALPGQAVAPSNESVPESAQGKWLVWIGQRMWPQPHILNHRDTENDFGFGIWDFGLRSGANVTAKWQHASDLNPKSKIQNPKSPPPRLRASVVNLLSRSLLVDPPTDEDRLWAIDLCLRSPAAAVVVADGGGLKLSHTRRLQLAAESGGALSLLARPLHELATPSAASTRWRVQRLSSPSISRPQWRIELVRCKGVQRELGMDATTTLVLEHHRATGCVHLSAPLADRPAETPARSAKPPLRRTG
jgi:hypothetical protein